MISVLTPTRGRPHLLERSVNSLLTLADHPRRVQLCYAVDLDDSDTVSYVSTSMRRGDVIHVEPVRLGYSRLHEYVNALAGKASGTWMLLWNDDAVMQTRGWDTIVTSYEDMFVLDIASNHNEGICAFPVVPTRFVREIGHFSLNCHNDTWWQELGEFTETRTRVPIEVMHDRYDMTGNNLDETYVMSTLGQRSTEFGSDEMTQVRRLEAEKIRDLICRLT